ncbi:MAG TPA: TolC family protein [Fimbriiglobus sp.]|nr:TolC family protein [Fimbriiglobus sp.]
MKRKRWARRLVGGVLGLAAVGGCRQQIYLEPQDFQAQINNVELRKLENEPLAGYTPLAAPSGHAPATVLDPSRPPRLLTLKEAMAIALEQGNIGSSPINPGLLNEQLSQFTGRGTTQSDTIRAFALDRAVAGAEVERAVSKFDARWINSITWNKNDQPTLTLQQSFSNGDSASLSSTLAKPLPTGGVAGITFSTNYLNLSNPPTNTQFVTLNTSYTPRLQFIFEQPLLQGFGVEINQLLSGHPGSALIPGLRPSGGQGTEGILVTRIRHDQALAQFEVQVNTMLLNVETAYWNLYSAYYNLAAQEEGLKQSLDSLFFIRERVKSGLARPGQVHQLQAQAETFRGQVLTARGQVLERERALRGLLGMRSDDGTRLVPVDEPTLVPLRPEWTDLYAEALRNKPELAIARHELKAQQLNLVLQRNLRRPDLRFFSSYDIAGLGARLDGGESSSNALHNFILNNFNNWQLGLRLDMPLGFRDGNALVRQAQLNLYRSYFLLADQERKVIEILGAQYRQVLLTHGQIMIQRSRRTQLEKFVKLEAQFRQIGDQKFPYETTILNLIQAQRDLAQATAQEFQAIADYNIALASLEYAKGTIQNYNNVTVADGPLPQHVEKKAADHFRATDAALKLREHPAGLPYGPLSQWQPGTGSAPGALPPPPGTPVPPMPWQPSQPGAPTPVPLQPETPTAPPPGGTPIASPNAGGPVSESPFRPIGTLTLPPSPRRTLPADATPAPTPTAESGGSPTVALPPTPPQ